MLTEEQSKLLIKKMFEKQDELNIHTNGNDWKTNKTLKWYRAIWTEAAELIDYTNWKWWKKQDISIKDIEMELIDIWHFALSDMMTHTDIDICTENSTEAFKCFFEVPENIDLDNIRKTTETLVYLTVRDARFNLESFIKLCSSINMNIKKIYKLYMGKNILNKFRQDNGYKQQIYQKIWDGQEDNIYLMKFLDSVNEIGEDFEQEIYNKLQVMYKKYTI
jgi:dimeric dUTPase (all-alpha-NTP-PPase superfamily)